MNTTHPLFILWTEYAAPIDLLAEATGRDPEGLERSFQNAARNADLERAIEDHNDEVEALPEFDTPEKWAAHVRVGGK